MRDLLESIIKVERDLLKSANESEASVNQMIDDARKQCIALENEYNNNYDAEKAKKIAEAEKSEEQYTQSLIGNVNKLMKKKEDEMMKKKVYIQEKMLEIVLNR